MPDRVFFLSCRASAIFIGVYEPAKQQLLKSLPENISSVAHFVSWLSLLKKRQPLQIIYVVTLFVMCHQLSP